MEPEIYSGCIASIGDALSQITEGLSSYYRMGMKWITQVVNTQYTIDIKHHVLLNRFVFLQLHDETTKKERQLMFPLYQKEKKSPIKKGGKYCNA